MKRLLILLPFITLTACSVDDKNDSSESESFRLVDELGSPGNGYDVKSLNLQSITRMQADSLLLNYKDPLHAIISAQFISDSSVLALNAYTTNLANNDGVRLDFTPSTDEENAIDVHLYTRDYPSFHFCTISNAMSSDGQFGLRVQLAYLRNDGPTILIWNTYNDGRNENKKNFTYFDSSNADCDTRQRIFIDHFGSGRLWGFQIQQTRIFETRRSEHLL